MDIPKQKENVLLLCLSKLSQKPFEITDYAFICENGSRVSFTGIMTNEAPVKAVISELASKGERLDRIVIICSDDVRKTVKPGNAILADQLMRFGCLELSTLEYFQKVVNAFVCAHPLYKNKPIIFETVPIGNTPLVEEVSETVIDVAKLVKKDAALETDFFTETHLYIDYNGGQRYIANMLFSIANLLTLNKSVKIQKVLAMNFENKVNGVVPVEDMNSLFRTADFVAGLQEIIAYGRLKGLKDYFWRSKDKDIQKILGNLDKFLQHLQLCHTSYIMENRTNIKKELERFIIKANNEAVSPEKSDKEAQKKQVHSILFSYVAKDILREYEPLLDGELPEILFWCTKHEFMQQALTFCTDLLPEYLVNKGHLQPTEEEREEYEKMLGAFSSKDNKTEIFMNDLFRFMSFDSTATDKAYNWFTEYFLASSFFRRELEKKNIRIMLGDACGTADALFFKTAPYSRNKDQMILWQIQNETGRVVSNLEPEKLQEILKIYFSLKEQRNISNHASTRKGDIWNYQTLKKKFEKIHSLLIANRRVTEKG